MHLLWQSFQSLNSNWHFTGDHSVNHGESTDALKYLQEQLRQEMEDHIKGNMLDLKKRKKKESRLLHIGKPMTCVMCVFFISSEGKGNVEKVQDRVTRINQLRETLEEETAKNGAAAENSDLCHQVSKSCHFNYTEHPCI